MIPWVYAMPGSGTPVSPPETPTAVPGVGVGRTHLFLGQIHNAAAPAAAAADLYVLSGGYGNTSGNDVPLLVETPDLAPLGVQGRLRLRRISVPFQYDAACTLAVTPIVDYRAELEPTVVAYGAPGSVTRQAVQVKLLHACTTVRLRIEVVTRAGPIEFYTPTIYYAPLSSASGVAMGTPL